MIQPVDLQDFFLSFFSSAMVILTGALYALLFALGKRLQHRGLMFSAYGAYAMLAVSVLVLANVLHLNGAWSSLVAVMLVGYFIAPHGIWHLCVGTHETQEQQVTIKRKP